MYTTEKKVAFSNQKVKFKGTTTDRWRDQVPLPEDDSPRYVTVCAFPCGVLLQQLSPEWAMVFCLVGFGLVSRRQGLAI